MSYNCAQEFFLRVSAMRNAQKRYYKDRTYTSLGVAKKLEREVDGYIEKGMQYLDSLPKNTDQQLTFEFMK